jgi:hypothetical protein
MKTPTPEEAAAATNREIFQGLAKILAMLATRMQTQDEAATQIAMLVPRAEELCSAGQGARHRPHPRQWRRRRTRRPARGLHSGYRKAGAARRA